MSDSMRESLPADVVERVNSWLANDENVKSLFAKIREADRLAEELTARSRFSRAKASPPETPDDSEEGE